MKLLMSLRLETVKPENWLLWPLWGENIELTTIFHLPNPPLLPLARLIFDCVHDVLERKMWMMLENMHRAIGPAAPPPPPSLFGFCVQLWSCVRLFLFLSPTVQMLVCVYECVCERERECDWNRQNWEGWRKQIYSRLAAHSTIRSSSTGNGGSSAKCASKFFHRFLSVWQG